MDELILKLKQKKDVPIESSNLSPDIISGKDLDEIGELECWVGNQKKVLKDVFEISGLSGSAIEETKISILGDTSKLRRVGWRMTGGEIEIERDIGFYLGERMSGGRILVKGDVDGWAGVRMQGGEIEVLGNAGHFLGGAYWGTANGMQGGTIKVKGNAGSQVGCWMSKGLITIGGNAGDFVGIHMQKGNIAVYGDSGIRPGAGMKGGRITILGKVPSILPSFSIEGKRKSARIGKEKVEGSFYLFTGDQTEIGEGRLFVSVEQNPHLSKYEAYIW
jgi:formylmethanofuran dehydrogenase subunit C